MVSSFAVLAVDGVVMDARHIISINFHDEAGSKSDTLDIEIMPNMPRPNPDAKVTLVLFNSLGQVMPCGLFHVESVTRQDNQRLTFHATGVEFNEKQLKKQSHHYSKTKLSSIVKMVGKRMGHKVKFDAPDPKIESLNQTKESDLNFLNRLAEKYDCLFSIKNDVVYFVSKSSDTLPIFTVNANKAKSSSITRRKIRYKSCEATYYDSAKAKEKKVKVGKEPPLLKIKSKGKTDAEAKLDAKNALAKINRWSTHGQISTIGQKLYASTRLLLLNTHNYEDDGIYFIPSATHSFSRYGGWTVDLDMESFKIKE
jgi:phage protein D